MPEVHAQLRASLDNVATQCLASRTRKYDGGRQRNVLKDFPQSNRFGRIYRAVREDLKNPRVMSIVTDNPYTRFVGMVFQGLVDEIGSNTSFPGRVYLPSEPTFGMYAQMHPQMKAENGVIINKVITNLFGVKSINGISTPDALLVTKPQKEPLKRSRITSVIESTTNLYDQKTSEKFTGFKKDFRRFSVLFDPEQAHLLFITPRDLEIPFWLRGNIDRVGIGLVELDKVEVIDLADELFWAYKPDQSAKKTKTLGELVRNTAGRNLRPTKVYPVPERMPRSRSKLRIV